MSGPQHQQTLTDRWLARIKNVRWVAALILVASGIVYLASVADAITKMRAFLGFEAEAPSPTEDYSAAWRCIVSAERPRGNAAATRPDSRILNNALLDMTRKGEQGCVQSLLAAGANIDAYRFPKQNDAFDAFDGPPLHLALGLRHWSTARFLLDSGAKPNLTTSDDYTALDLATILHAPQDLIDDLKARGAHFGQGRFTGDSM